MGLSRQATGPLLTTSAVAVAAKAVSLLIAIVSVPLAVGYLGTQRYGLWMLASSMLGMVYLLDGGVTPELKNRMSAAFARGDERTLAGAVRASLALGGVVAAGGIVLSVVSTLVDWANILHVNEPLAVREAQIVVPLLLLAFAVRAGLSCVDAIYAGVGRIREVQWADLVAAPASLIALVLCVGAKVGLPVLACVLALPAVTVRLWLLYRYVTAKGEIRYGVSPSPWPVLKASLPRGFAFLGIKVAEVTLVWLPTFVLARVANLDDVARYSVIQKAATVPQIVVVALLPVYWPAFTVAWERGDRRWLQRVVITAAVTTLALYALFVTGVGFLGPTLVQWWTRGRIVGSHVEFVAVGAFLGVQTTFYWVSTFLHSISDFGFELVLHLACLVVFVTLAIPLGARFGLQGIAFSLASAWTLACLGPASARVVYWFRSGEPEPAARPIVPVETGR